MFQFLQNQNFSVFDFEVGFMFTRNLLHSIIFFVAIVKGFVHLAETASSNRLDIWKSVPFHLEK